MSFSRPRYSPPPAKPVFNRTDGGFTHLVHVMYHGTSPANADAILREGFRLDKCKSSGMLGVGIYASTDPDKTLNYGSVTFKLLVYQGLVRDCSDPKLALDFRNF